MINFNEEFANKIQTRFSAESVVAGRLSDDFKVSGAKTVKALTPLTVPMVDYTRSGSNRYGTPGEMQDMIQEMTMTQDKSFTLTIDKGNFDDGAFLKEAPKMLGLQLSERAIPLMDQYVLGKLAQNAGKVVGSSTAPTKSTICGLISAATEHLDDCEVPNNDRTLFVSASVYALLKHSDELLAVESLSRDAIRRGVVGRYDNMDVVKVPSGRWPKYVNFIVAHRCSAIAPLKISQTNIHKDPPGISGYLLEGRFYYDLFVFGVKCDGIYVHVNTASNCGTVVADPAITAASGAMSCATDGATIKYTTDGSDPRYSPDAKTGTQSDVVSAGTVVKAYAFKDAEGFYPSAVVSATLV